MLWLPCPGAPCGMLWRAVKERSARHIGCSWAFGGLGWYGLVFCFLAFMMWSSLRVRTATLRSALRSEAVKVRPALLLSACLRLSAPSFWAVTVRFTHCGPPLFSNCHRWLALHLWASWSGPRHVFRLSQCGPPVLLGSSACTVWSTLYPFMQRQFFAWQTLNFAIQIPSRIARLRIQELDCCESLQS